MFVKDRIWGDIMIDDPLITELILSPEIQRLKNIAQAGITTYLEPERDVTRFEHSVGVFYILRKFKRTREEQIAGLIHDFTHTAFSHVVDYVYANTSHDYHERKYEKKYRESTLYKIIEKHHIDPKLFYNLENFNILEQPIPNLCADRLDYFIRDYFISTKNKKNIDTWINSLKIMGERMLFTDKIAAKSFALSFLNEMENVWFSPKGVYQYSLFAELLQTAISNGTIVQSSFEQDDKTLLKILKSKMKNAYHEFLIKAKKEIMVNTEYKEKAYPYVGKFRYIDPLIYVEKGSILLTSLDMALAKKIKELKDIYSQPRFISSI